MGFLYAGALAGLATLAWPLYLHFFQRPKPRMQVVPSLRIFGVEIRRRRRRTIEELLLLLCRAMVLAALFALLGQPFLASTRLLPLPLLEPEPLLLGVVFDDSLPSCAAMAGESRLDLQKAWLTARIRELPDDAGVVLVTTSVPTAGPPLDKDAAAELVAEIETVPFPGDPVAGIRGVLRAVSGRKCALCFVGSRTVTQWDGTVRDDIELPVFYFRDVTECAPSCSIETIEPDPSTDAPGRWACRLRGVPDALIGKTLSVAGDDGSENRITFTPVEAFRLRADIDTSSGKGDAVSSARLEAGYEHPWFRYHFQPGRAVARRSSDVLVIHESTPGAVLAKKIFSAAVNAANRSVALRYHDAGTPVGEVAAETVVLLSVASPSTTLTTHLRTYVDAGGRLVVIPPELGTGSTSAGFVPAWEPVRRAAADQMTPLRIDELIRRTGALDSLVLSGLLDMAPSVVRSPQLGAGWEPVLSAADGVPLLARRPSTGDGVTWLLATPLTLAEDGIAMHPLFPHLVSMLLSDEQDRTASAREVFVGEQVTLQELFGQDAVAGLLTTPAGQTIEVVQADGDPERIYLETPGVYTLGERGKTRTAPVNYPRLPDDQPVPRDEWSRRLPNIGVRWMGADDALPDDPFRLLDAPGEDPLRKYDVSPVCAVLLALALLAEGLLYALTALRRKQEYA